VCFYRQFAITMAMSIVLSGVVALTLTPVLCAMILKPHAKPGDQQRGMAGLVNRVFKWMFGSYAYIPRALLAIVLGLAAGYGIFELLHIEVIHELVSEQLPLTEDRVKIIAGVMSVLFIFTFRSALSGSEPGEAKKTRTDRQSLCTGSIRPW